MSPRFRNLWVGTVLLLLVGATGLSGQSSSHGPVKAYVGFDRNEYPGNATLAILRKTFAFTGYWLNPPPGAVENTWQGKRARLRQAGFGFLVLFNGRLDAELKKAPDAGEIGTKDADAAADAARREGFPRGAIIFLDQEQGGRMLPEQKAYIYAWVDAISAAGFRAGIYCSGMRSTDGENAVTAEDIRQTAGSREITYWATNDACPPSPGCSVSLPPPSPSKSGVDFAEVWQFAQSPQRKDIAGRCNNYSHDGNCYPPGTNPAQGFHIDLNAATSADPSHGRTH